MTQHQDLFHKHWQWEPAKAMTTLEVALTQIKVRETTGKNDGIPQKRYMMGDALPWCAGFLMACNQKARLDLPIVTSLTEYYPARAVEALEDLFKRKGWHGVDSNAIGPNVLVFFDNRGLSDAGPGRHVGIIEKVKGDQIHTVDGNWGNGVKRVKRLITDRGITGFGHIPPALPGGYTP